MRDDLAVVEHDHAGRDAKGARHVVGHDDRGHAAFAGQLEGEFVDHRGHDRIESGSRLVAEEQLRIEREGAGQADALFHSAADLGRFEIFETRQADHLQFSASRFPRSHRA